MINTRKRQPPVVREDKPGAAWKAAVHRLLRRSSFLSGAYASYLVRRKGLDRPADWVRSYRTQMSVDAAGRPIPWITYSALEALAQRAKPDFSVFEYGSGNSTRWWAERVRRVVSCESDPAWADRIRADLPPRAEIHQVDLARDGVEAYASVIDRWPASFEIVVIDGDKPTRQACGRHALAALKPGGVIVWDNAEFGWDQPGFDALKRRGFQRLDCPGFGPINFYPWITAFFFRQPNVLGLDVLIPV